MAGKQANNAMKVKIFNYMRDKDWVNVPVMAQEICSSREHVRATLEKFLCYDYVEKIEKHFGGKVTGWRLNDRYR